MCFRPSQTVWLSETTYSDPAESSVGPATTTRPGNSSVFWNKSLRIASKAEWRTGAGYSLRTQLGVAPNRRMMNWLRVSASSSSFQIATSSIYYTAYATRRAYVRIPIYSAVL